MHSYTVKKLGQSKEFESPKFALDAAREIYPNIIRLNHYGNSTINNKLYEVFTGIDSNDGLTVWVYKQIGGF